MLKKFWIGRGKIFPPLSNLNQSPNSIPAQLFLVETVIKNNNITDMKKFHLKRENWHVCSDVLQFFLILASFFFSNTDERCVLRFVFTFPNFVQKFFHFVSLTVVVAMVLILAGNSEHVAHV